ncbi:MAG TPA: recombinase family protein [Pyrinomonadaceae bacterium]|jgi:DNA invertase Pin-like site-specific DNA recombinase
MPTGYFSYIRVSTTRQGQTGTSLAEQRESIQCYAARFDLPIIKEFEEQETAAKHGRPVFAQMLSSLKAHRAAGVIMHKIDRSARNLKDWADLGELVDCGVELHFANESLDLHSRGGRLSADIQAVVAADYIRNLREETKKGFYGRIKQGLYPMPAPLGYLDCGQGQAKTPDPLRAPLIKAAFELYATGSWGIIPLCEKLYEMGLRTKTGKRVAKNSLHDLLRNPFYAGLIRIQKTGELFPGAHVPLISQSLFGRTQMIMSGKHSELRHQHSFLFRRHLRCGLCGLTLIGEMQKGYTYYRCQARSCPQKTIREELVAENFAALLQQLRFSEDEMNYLRTETEKNYRSESEEHSTQLKVLTLQLEQLGDRISKLTDAYIEGVLEKDLYIEKKNRLLQEEQATKERLTKLNEDYGIVARKVGEFLELANNAYLSYESGLFEEKRELVKTVTSNFLIEHKTVLPKPYLPFELVLKRAEIQDGGPQRDDSRTLSGLVHQLSDYFRHEEIAISRGSLWAQ